MEMRFDGNDKFRILRDGEKQFLPCLKVVLKNREESRDYSGNKLCADLYSNYRPNKA
jgi:hypothetical protein